VLAYSALIFSVTKDIFLVIDSKDHRNGWVHANVAFAIRLLVRDEDNNLAMVHRVGQHNELRV